MDMNSLIHHRGAATPAADGFRAPATNVSPFQTPSLPGLRAHLPSLPIRLAALQPAVATGDAQPSAAQRNPATATTTGSDRPIAPSGAAPPAVGAPLQPAGAASQQATSLAPLRFIIPSSHCPPSHSSAFAGSSSSIENASVNIRPAAPAPPQIKQEALATSAPKSYQESVQDQSQRVQALHHTHNRPPPIDISLLIASSVVNDLDGTTDGSLTDNRNKKSPGKRNRAVKNPNRSTKSKARPGLRKGKWTEEEERYATQLTNYFKEGLLPIERGTMLRLYLSQKLNCEPMRITKKFTGGECIGKQVFRPCSPTPDTRVRLMQAQLELVALEAAFIKKLKENKEEVPGLTDDVDMNLAPGAIAVSARRKKRGPNRKAADGGEGDDGFTSDSSTSSGTASTYSRRSEKKSGDNVDDANAVGLLLDFFYKASSKNDPESKSEAAAAAPTAAASQVPLFPKREVSAATSVASSEPDPELEEEQSYKQPNDELANSPTKRMRTLSISQCHTDVSTSPKRSRVGSFTAITSHP